MYLETPAHLSTSCDNQVTNGITAAGWTNAGVLPVNALAYVWHPPLIPPVRSFYISSALPLFLSLSPHIRSRSPSTSTSSFPPSFPPTFPSVSPLLLSFPSPSHRLPRSTLEIALYVTHSFSTLPNFTFLPLLSLRRSCLHFPRTAAVPQKLPPPRLAFFSLHSISFLVFTLHKLPSFTSTPVLSHSLIFTSSQHSTSPPALFLLSRCDTHTFSLSHTLTPSPLPSPPFPSLS